MKRTPLFWHKSENFGDCLAPMIAEKISGIQHVFVNDNTPKYCILGSILNDDCISTAEVWGAGFVQPQKNPPRPLKIHAVRGPMSMGVYRANGISCPKTFGDPALLMPRLFPMELTGEHEIGIVAHWVDRECINLLFGHLPVKIIDCMNPVQQVLTEILSFRSIISTSLHGLIVAQAYGIPAAWATVSGRVIGGGFKFRDYFASVGCKPMEHVYRAGDNPQQWIEAVKYQTIGNFDSDKLYNSCPFLP